MPEKNQNFDSYLSKLKERKTVSKIYSKHQQVGLLIAELLGDLAHRALYIKLAKERNPEELLRVAREVASRKNVKNKGAYFMRIVHDNLKS